MTISISFRGGFGTLERERDLLSRFLFNKYRILRVSLSFPSFAARERYLAFDPTRWPREEQTLSFQHRIENRLPSSNMGSVVLIPDRALGGESADPSAPLGARLLIRFTCAEREDYVRARRRVAKMGAHGDSRVASHDKGRLE